MRVDVGSTTNIARIDIGAQGPLGTLLGSEHAVLRLQVSGKRVRTSCLWLLSVDGWRRIVGHGEVGIGVRTRSVDDGAFDRRGLVLCSVSNEKSRPALLSLRTSSMP